MLITEEYRKLNHDLHVARDDYGRSLQQWIHFIKPLVKKGDTVLNYGCGKSQLGGTAEVKIVNYDPAIPELANAPSPADVVICTEVLEHVEPDCLDEVLDDLARLTMRHAFFVIPNGPALKFLADGRNAHLIQENYQWWLPKLWARFEVLEFHYNGEVLIAICGKG